MRTTAYDYDRYTRLKADRESRLKASRDIVDRAKAEGRDLDRAEQDAVQAALDTVKRLDTELKAQGTAMIDRVLNLGTAEDFGPDGMPATMFDEATAKGFMHAVKSRTAFRAEVPAKTVLGSTTLLPPSGQYIEPGVYPGATPLATLFRQQPADGPVIRYYRMNTATAAIVGEGAVKPDAAVVTTAVDLPLVKIATTSKVSDELSEDAPYMVAQLSYELQQAVLTMEATQILATFGATSGLLTSTGAAADVIDLTASAVAVQEGLNGTTPTAIVVSPQTLAAIRVAKANSGGSYHLDPLAAGPAMLHGVRLISTAATAPDTAWVVNGAGVTIYRRGPVTFEVGHSDDDWQRNLTTARAEERMACAVTRPSMVSRITLT